MVVENPVQLLIVGEKRSESCTKAKRFKTFCQDLSNLHSNLESCRQYDKRILTGFANEMSANICLRIVTLLGALSIWPLDGKEFKKDIIFGWN